jgi:hypothetical protein
MASDEATALQQLLTNFQVEALGHGDANEGANVLAAMATTIANLAPTDANVQTPDGRPARLGVNLLVSGSASAAAVLDEIITEVGRRQSNLASNLSDYLEWIKEQSEKPGAELPPMAPGSNSLIDALAETQTETDPLYGSRADPWIRILNEAPSEQLPDLACRPKFLVTATRPSDLEAQLRNLRPGRPLVHLGVARPGDLAKLADPGAALIEGRFAMGAGVQPIRANLLITDPLQMLGEAAKGSVDHTAWLRHFLWLCDGNAGPDAPSPPKAPDTPETATVRFRRALNHVITQRLNLPKKKPLVLPWDTREAVIRFRGFLSEMEPRLLGISGAARNLIDSLAFGLGEMARIEDRLPLSPAGVEAFARFLVRRMANARTMLLHAGAVARRRSDIERIYQKLEKGPCDARKIYRDLTISSSDCYECLDWMEEAKIVNRTDNKWERIAGARLSFDRCTTPLLEI